MDNNKQEQRLGDLTPFDYFTVVKDDPNWIGVVFQLGQFPFDQYCNVACSYGEVGTRILTVNTMVIKQDVPNRGSKTNSYKNMVITKDSPLMNAIIADVSKCIEDNRDLRDSQVVELRLRNIESRLELTLTIETHQKK